MRCSLSNFLVILLFVAAGFSGVQAGEILVNNGKTEILYSVGTYQQLAFTSNLSSILFREVQTKNGPFTELFVQGYGFSNTVGDPKLPVYHKIIEMPLNAGFEINIIHQKFKEYDLPSLGISNKIIPAQAPLSKNITDPDQVPFVYNQSTYMIDDYLGGSVVRLEPIGIMRSVNMARLDISPVMYNPVTNKIRVYESLEVTVTFKNADIPATLQMKKRTYSPYFNNLYGLIPNYQEQTDTLITEGPVTFVIVSDPNFQSALQPLVKWKTKKGFKVIQAYTNNPNVGNTTTSIKNYLTGLYNNPPTGYNPPSFVLFVGDVAQIPAWTTGGHPSDLRYCEYTNDNIPEVFYGRFSAQTLTQLQSYLDKTLEYEQYLMPADAFLNEVVMVAGADANYGPIYGNGQINYGTNYYFNTAHNLTSHTYLQPESSGANYSQQIRNNVSSGVAFANYTAHGSEAGWADPAFVISHISSLQNNHKYCLMVGNCCKAANFSVTCFAEEITRTPNKGALGYIGCSDYSYWDEDYWWGVGFKSVSTNPAYTAQHLGAYDVTFHDHGEPVDKWFVTMDQMVVGGCLAVQESNSGMKQYYWETYCLFGDPSLSIYYSVPAMVTASYQNTVLVGTNSLTVNTEPWAYVALSLNDTVLLDAKCADSTGIVNLSFTPFTSPDTAALVVTKQNRKPHIGSINVIPATGPYLMLGNYTISDSIGGNNNHLADFSETIKLNLTINNIGVLPANFVTATLASADTNVVITVNNCNLGNVPYAGNITVENAFTISIHNNVQDQHKVQCILTMTDGTNVWTSPLVLNLNAPVLFIGNTIIVDPAPGGNGNGVLDPGESAMLKINTINSGHAVVTNALAHLTVAPSSAPYIIVSNPNSYIGLLPPSGFNYLYFDVVTNGITPPGTSVTLDYLVTAGSSNQYSVQKQLDVTIGQVPQYNMSNSTFSTCNGKFYDSGGLPNNYGDMEYFVMTFNPAAAGTKVKVTFNNFHIEPEPGCNYDWLKIYDGPSSSSALIGTYCDTISPGNIVSTNGPLTFQFSSDYNTNYAGWDANISCFGGPLTLLANSFPSNVCLGSSSQLIAIPSGGSGTYTYLWTPSTYLNDPTIASPVSTPTDNITYTVTVNDGTNSITSGPVTLTIHPVPLAPTITENGEMLVSDATTGNQWYLNGGMIPNANGQTYTPSVSGDYYVVVTDEITGCSSGPSNIITFLMTGIKPVNAERFVLVYPNPFRDNVTITYELPQAGSAKVSLYDAFGKELKVLTNHSRQNPGKYLLHMNGEYLNTGLYYIKIQTDTYTAIKKLMLTK